MKNDINFLTLFFKGILIGIGAIIPGLSGGTMAVATKTFEIIVESVANVFHHFKRSFYVLAPIATGALFSIITLAKPLSCFGTEFPLISKVFYLTIALLSIIFFAKNNIQPKINIAKTSAIILGIILSFSISYFTQYFKLFDGQINYIFLLLIGFPLAISLVLPGISFSYMLLFFGIYERTLSAIDNFDLYFLIVLFSSVLIGTFVFSKCLLKLIEKHKQETYSFVLGFVLISIIDIFIS